MRPADGAGGKPCGCKGSELAFPSVYLTQGREGIAALLSNPTP